MSEKSHKFSPAPPGFTREQVAAISSIIVKRAFETVDEIEAHIESYIANNIEKIVVAALGIEKNRWGDGYTLYSTNSFSGPLLCYIKQRAIEKATARGAAAVKELVDDKKFKQYATSELKKSISSYYDEEYNRAMMSLIADHLALDPDQLTAQIEEIMRVTKQNVEGASKATMETFLLCAGGKKGKVR